MSDAQGTGEDEASEWVTMGEWDLA